MELIKKKLIVFFVCITVLSNSTLKAEEEEIALQAVADQIQVLVKDLKNLTKIYQNILQRYFK